MGSGHILVYAFDVFMQLYEAEGQSPRTAAELILKNNLFGLDIDQRAFQLAYFALMMKGRQYSRRILSKQLRPNVYVVPNNSEIGEAELQLVQMQFNDQKKALQDLLTLVEGFKNGAELGSLIKFEGLDFENLKSGLNNTNISFFDQSIKEMILVGELLQQKYEIGITNPPYMGSSGFGPVLSKFSKKQYPNSKSDLFAMFMERWNKAISCTGYNTMVTMQSWMFLTSYESMRKSILATNTIANMMHMENMVMGIAFGTAVTIIKHNYIKGFKGTYHQIKTVDASNNLDPTSIPIPGNRFNQISQDAFNKIPGSPISYWVSENMINLFQEQKSISDFYDLKVGIQTGDNPLFYKKHWEINPTCDYWVKCNKNGEYRRWYGNLDTVIFWKNNGEKIKKHKSSRPQNSDYYFREGVAWSNISSSANISARFENKGMIFDQTVPTIFPIDDATLIEIIAYMNSKIAITVAIAISPTMHFNTGEVAKYPYIPYKDGTVNKFVKENIKISKDDWDSLETSWDFKQHPLL